MTHRRDTCIPRRSTRSEAGFTLLELLIVIIIIAILVVAMWSAMASAKRTSRAHAMTTAATSVGRAVSAFNRMNPPITVDRITTGSSWTSGQTEAAGGLYSTTGERLLDPWPDSPYGASPVVVRRGAACPAAATAGTVWVCRVGGGRASSFRVRAWATDRSGASYVVYDQIVN